MFDELRDMVRHGASPMQVLGLLREFELNPDAFREHLKQILSEMNAEIQENRMKRVMKIALSAVVLLLALGCNAQVPSNPTVSKCADPSTTTYAPLNQALPASGLAYTDSKPAAGTYCYLAQSANGAQVSTASNVAGPFTTNGANSVALTWDAPTTGVVPTGYILSRAPAITSTILAPNLKSGSVAEVKPALPVIESQEPVYAMVKAPTLKGRVR